MTEPKFKPRAAARTARITRLRRPMVPVAPMLLEIRDLRSQLRPTFTYRDAAALRAQPAAAHGANHSPCMSTGTAAEVEVDPPERMHPIAMY